MQPAHVSMSTTDCTIKSISNTPFYVTPLSLMGHSSLFLTHTFCQPGRDCDQVILQVESASVFRLDVGHDREGHLTQVCRSKFIQGMIPQIISIRLSWSLAGILLLMPVTNGFCTHSGLLIYQGYMTGISGIYVREKWNAVAFTSSEVSSIQLQETTCIPVFTFAFPQLELPHESFFCCCAS